MRDFAPLATVSRDGLIESTHLGDLAITDATGRLVASVGDPGRWLYYRSSGKPLQALGVVQSGAAERFGFTPAELAICCASHSGSAAHVQTVLGILSRLGLRVEDFACGVHDPGDAEERRRLLLAGEKPSPLHNNCSGKHVGMLATALALGAPVAGYLHLDHPVQRLINRNLELATGVAQEQFHFGADGCGAPTVGLPLQAIATSFARLANPQDMPEDFRTAAERITAAMAAAPEMVSSAGSFNSELLAAGEGRIVIKGGAEGLYALAVKDERRLGIAIKMSDGSFRAQSPVVLRVLEKLGALTDAARERLEPHFAPVIRNCHGAMVGNIEAVVDLEL